LVLYHLFWLLLVVSKKQLPAYLTGLAGAVDDFPKMWRKRKKWLPRKHVALKTYWRKITLSEKEVMEMILRRSKLNRGKAIWPVTLYLRFFF
jgi:hypothetical protein